MDRPRRYPEDGKTMMQMAQELKEYKNLGKGTKPTLIITSKSNDILVAKLKCVNISLGYDDNMTASNVNLSRDKDLVGRKEFIEKSPEINLLSDLNIDLNLDNFLRLVTQPENVIASPLKEKDDELERSWVDITSKGLKPSTSQNSANDRSDLEC
jgi:hypothetical protein